jgi:hypothetical protein
MMVDGDAKKIRYRKLYGSALPDYSKCCALVFPSDGGFAPYQCTRKAAHGPEGAYCKMHDPAAIEARKKAAQAKWDAVARLERPKLYAMDMLDVLKRIAAGHNDPQRIANEIVSKIENG